MKIWAIANQKGGVGKTTTAVTLAGLLIKQGHPTLLVDLDPHGSMTSYFGFDPDSLEHSIYHLFSGPGSQPGIPPQQLLQDVGLENLRLLPASTALATIERQLGAKKGKGLVLKHAIDTFEGQYDYALIDCSPALGILMINALAACEHLLIPVQTEFLALKGLERMVHTLGMIMRARKQELTRTIVPTMFDRRTRASIQSLRMLRKKYSDELWGSVIPVDTQFREASHQRLPLSIMLPQSRGALAYSALLNMLQA